MATSPNDIDGVKPGGGGDDESACGSFVAGLIWFISILLIICTFPFSLCVCVRMVQVSKDIIVNFIKSLKIHTLHNLLYFAAMWEGNGGRQNLPSQNK